MEAAVSTAGRAVVFTDPSGVVRLWDRGSNERAAELPGGSDRVAHVALSADGRTLAVAREDTEVQLWDVRARTPLGQPLPGTSNPQEVFGNAKMAFTSDGSAFLTTGVGAIRVWEGILWRDLDHLRAQICGLVTADLTRAEWTAIAPGLPYRSTCGR